MDTVITALQHLYKSPDDNLRKEANDWLIQFQQTAEAWQVADAILRNAEQPTEHRFFAAQTLRTKVQFDIYSLPTEHHGSLRDSLLHHIETFRGSEHQSIATQLAVTISDLAIQMDDAWDDVIASLFNRFSNPDAYTILLDILRMFPEENANMKLMTDSVKRNRAAQRMKQATPKVMEFLCKPQSPNPVVVRKLLECFLSWVKYASLESRNIVSNPLVLECIRCISEAHELSEISTDIIIEVLRMAGDDIALQPVIQNILPLLKTLKCKFDGVVQKGPQQAVQQHENELLQICRIYVETGESLVPLIMEQITNPEVQEILHIILQCTSLPSVEISSIPSDFWCRLATQVCQHPEQDVKIDQFKEVFSSLLGVVIRQCALPANEDPFQVDDDYIEYRQRLLDLAHDCLTILTPNTALEQVLQSLQKSQVEGVTMQEAHFYVLTTVGQRADVREDSVLWQLVQSLPPLISQQVQDNTVEAAVLHYTKKTAIELLGHLYRWVKIKPEFLRSALDMISTVLLGSAPAGSPPTILERTKQVQQAASIAFKDICLGCKSGLHDLVPSMCELYVNTMSLPIRMHLFIVEGVGAVVAHMKQDEAFKQGIERLITPLIQGLSSERDKPNVLCEILDRVTTVVRHIRVQDGSPKALACGALISNQLWPLMQQILSAYPGDPKVVEKSCRVIKHCMRCVPDLFMPKVPELAETLITAFSQHQHSSFLYSAEILANTYAKDPQIVPVLTRLFHELSGTGLQCLAQAQNCLEEITELVEDFYGMYERYLRYAPMIVLESPTLLPALMLWPQVIFVQQKDAIEAVIAFIEAVFQMVSPPRGYEDETKLQHGKILRQKVLEVAPGFVEALFKLMAQVPTRYVQESIPCLVELSRDAFPQEFMSWLEVSFQHLPPSVASIDERRKFGQMLVQGDTNTIHDAIQDICYRCEQVALRSRGQVKR